MHRNEIKRKREEEQDSKGTKDIVDLTEDNQQEAFFQNGFTFYATPIQDQIKMYDNLSLCQFFENLSASEQSRVFRLQIKRCYNKKEANLWWSTNPEFANWYSGIAQISIEKYPPLMFNEVVNNFTNILLYADEPILEKMLKNKYLKDYFCSGTIIDNDLKEKKISPLILIDNFILALKSKKDFIIFEMWNENIQKEIPKCEEKLKEITLAVLSLFSIKNKQLKRFADDFLKKYTDIGILECLLKDLLEKNRYPNRKNLMQKIDVLIKVRKRENTIVQTSHQSQVQYIETFNLELAQTQNDNLFFTTTRTSAHDLQAFFSSLSAPEQAKFFIQTINKIQSKETAGSLWKNRFFAAWFSGIDGLNEFKYQQLCIEEVVNNFKSILLNGPSLTIQKMWGVERFRNYFCGREITDVDLTKKQISPEETMENFRLLLKAKRYAQARMMWDEDEGLKKRIDNLPDENLSGIMKNILELLSVNAKAAHSFVCDFIFRHDNVKVLEWLLEHFIKNGNEPYKVQTIPSLTKFIESLKKKPRETEIYSSETQIVSYNLEEFDVGKIVEYHLENNLQGPPNEPQAMPTSVGKFDFNETLEQEFEFNPNFNDPNWWEKLMNDFNVESLEDTSRVAPK